jgi:NAD+ kinase
VTPPRAVGLVVHGGRPAALAAGQVALAALDRPGVAVVGVAGDGWPDGTPLEVRDAEDFAEGLDVVMVLGGDGTFLRAAYLSRDRGVPLAGVDLGRLGFLSEIDVSGLAEALERIVAGDFTIEERMTLAVEILDADGGVVARSWGLNEASVERTEPQRLITLEVRVGQTVFANVPADAVICATPTGSTAYAFSAGGPIVSPLVDALLLVPVAPHSLFNRTLVVDPRESLTVRQTDGHTRCVVSCDGRETLPVPEGGCVRVFRGDVPVRLARLEPFDFYERTRRKFRLT